MICVLVTESLALTFVRIGGCKNGAVLPLHLLHLLVKRFDEPADLLHLSGNKRERERGELPRRAKTMASQLVFSKQAPTYTYRQLLRSTLKNDYISILGQQKQYWYGIISIISMAGSWHWRAVPELTWMHLNTYCSIKTTQNDCKDQRKARGPMKKKKTLLTLSKGFYSCILVSL